MRKLTEQDIASVIGIENEGFMIEQARVKGGSFSDSDHYGIAFGKNECGNYVTWQFKLTENNEAFDFYWGHYYAENENAALEDYRSREQ